MRAALVGAADEAGVDIAVEPAGLRRRAKRLVVLDVDSTLIRDEAIDVLAARAGVGERVAAITARAMAGELDFAESPGTLSGAYMRMAAGQKRFTSRQVGDRQGLTIIAKPVVAASRIPYEVRIGDTLVDPGIKIMPR